MMPFLAYSEHSSLLVTIRQPTQQIGGTMRPIAKHNIDLY